jgi:hypothetical protein
MPFDPALPLENTEIDAAQMRDQLTGLKALIDAIPAGPEGPPGPTGPPGEVTQQQLNSAVMGSAQNPTSVGTLSINFSDPPTQAELFAVQSKINELLSALQRQP